MNRLKIIAIWRSLLRWYRNLAAALVLLLVGILFTPLDYWWTRLLTGNWTDARGDVLVVLAGDMIGDGWLGPGSYWRTVYAAKAWEEGGWREIIISGGGGESITAAESMARFLESRGVPREAIRLENESLSTRESAVNLYPLLESMQGRKVLLTSDYHMYRALRSFEHEGIEITPRPLPDAGKRATTWYQRIEVFLVLAIETAKIGYYRLQGWL